MAQLTPQLQFSFSKVAYATELGAGSGTSYPTSLDTDSTQESTSTVARAAVPNDIGAAVVAIQTELGTTPSQNSATVSALWLVEHTAGAAHGAITSTSITNSGAITQNGSTTIGDAAADTLHHNANTITYEGATADDFETTFTITDPTADRTITIPNESVTIGLTRSEMISFTRNVALTTSLALTGAGFTPTACDCVWSIDGSDNSGSGMSDSSLEGGATTFTNSNGNAGNPGDSTTNFLHIETANNAITNGVIASYDTDGITITWSASGGGATGTAQFYCRFIR